MFFAAPPGIPASPADIAARVATHLPRGLRQEVVYQISGALVEKVWELQRALGETDNPILDLDRLDRSWREKLPLVVSDDTAKALLNTLVKDASALATQTARDLKATCRLVKANGGYELRRSLRLPSSLDGASLGMLLGIPAKEVPFRLELYPRGPERRPHPLALVTRRTTGDEEARFALEIPHGAVPEARGLSACAPVQLTAEAGKYVFPVREIKGGNALSDLPWVFVAKRQDEPVVELVGEGSIRTRFPDAFVAVSPNARVTAEEGSAAHAVGEVLETGRALYRVVGTVAIQTGESLISRVRTGANQEESFQYSVEGTYLSAGAYDSAVYCGRPRIVCYSEGGTRRVLPETEIQWTTRGNPGAWLPLSEECYGPISLRHAPGGEVRFLDNAIVVPSASRITFAPGANHRSGTIRLEGFRNPEVGVSPLPGLRTHVVQRPGRDLCEVEVATDGEPPPSLTVSLRWRGNREISLPVPFPARGGRFLGRDGRLLDPDEVIHLDRLGGVIAQVLVPQAGRTFLVEAVLQARDIPLELSSSLWLRENLREVTPGRHEIDLRVLQEACRLMFAMTEDLDARVQVSLHSQTAEQLPRRLRVAQYEGFLQRDEEAGDVFIPEWDVGSLGPGAKDLHLRAFPMWHPGREPDDLTRVSEHRWHFGPETRLLGPWLITAWDGNWCRLRPHCWPVLHERPAEAGQGAEAPAAEVSLETTVKLSDAEARVEACDAVLRRLSSEPSAADWEVIDAYLDRLDDLPATTFDVIDRLAHNPDAAALVLLRAGEDRFHTVWTNLERLPFCWALIPIGSWLKAAERRYRATREALAPLAAEHGDEVEAILCSQFQVFCTQAPLRIPGMQCVAELIQERVLGRPRSESQFLQLAVTPQGRQLLCGLLLDGARQTLLRLRADDQWPGGGGIEEWIHRQACVPRVLRELWQEAPAGAGYRAAVLNAPICAALAAVCGIEMPRELVFHVRRLREFDPAWFDTAYGCAMTTAIGHFLEAKEEFPG